MPDVEHLWTIACHGVTSDETGGLTLHRLMDMIVLGELPGEPVIVPVACTVLSQWRRNTEPGRTLQERIMLQHPDGLRVQVSAPHEVNLSTRHLFCAITHVPQLPLRGNGQYWFVVQRQDAGGGEWIDAPPTAGLWVPHPDQWPLPAGV
jgi:hypothetical protein